jgi:surface polysaccharide O-acyltransferase-like enzyme
MDEQNQSKTNLAWIDNIRVIAVVAVIVVHVSAYGTRDVDTHGLVTTNWWIVNFFESISRCCVPLFVMISGALLLPQTIGLRDFLKKRLSRILVPFVFWSLVYIAFKFAMVIHSSGFGSASQFGKWFTYHILQGAEFHLWYIYMLIGLYLFIPLLQPWVKVSGNKALLYFIVICAITIVLKQVGVLAMSMLDLRYFDGYVGYLVLGYYMAHRMTITTQIRNAAIAILLLGFGVTFIGTYLMTSEKGSFYDGLYDYPTLNVMFLSVGVFTIIKSSVYKSSNRMLARIKALINNYAFGIYLCHPLIMIGLSYFKINYRLISPVIGIPVAVVICLAISCAVIYVMRKLPFGKYVSG